MDVGELLEVPDRRAWRAWLRANHAKKREIWLVYPKKASGRARIPYGDAVDEALCFGWIDSTVKALDATRSAQRFTPRRRGSPVSEANKARMRRLVRERRMTAAGLAAVGGEETLRPGRLVVAADVKAALRDAPGAWKNWSAFPEEYRRIRLGWVEAARHQPELFATRLRHLVKMTAAGKMYGMERGVSASPSTPAPSRRPRGSPRARGGRGSRSGG